MNQRRLWSCSRWACSPFWRWSPSSWTADSVPAAPDGSKCCRRRGFSWCARPATGDPAVDWHHWRCDLHLSPVQLIWNNADSHRIFRGHERHQQPGDHLVGERLRGQPRELDSEWRVGRACRRDHRSVQHIPGGNSWHSTNYSQGPGRCQAGRAQHPATGAYAVGRVRPDMLINGQSPTPFLNILNPDNTIKSSLFPPAVTDLVLQGSQMTQNEIPPQGAGCPVWNGSSSGWKGQVDISGHGADRHFHFRLMGTAVSTAGS